MHISSTIPPTYPKLETRSLSFVLAVSLLFTQNITRAGENNLLPASGRSLDLALLLADVPVSRPRANDPAHKSGTSASAPMAASTVLFAAAAPVPTPADLPSVPSASTPVPLPSSSASPAPASSSSNSSPASTAPASAGSPAPGGGFLLNFQNASLGDVLNYLSSAAGFVIIQEQTVTGTINLVSRQPISAEECVDLLNAVLIEKGFIALRSGRILKIVPRENAEKRDLPVVTGSDPAQIPRRDNMVTQILPVRYAEVAKLVDSLRPLLSDRAVITSNDSSNAIILTDTQTNIHRIAEIVKALDTSISGISTLKIFPLRYADSKSIADLITQLFSPSPAAGGQQNGRGGNQGQGGPPNFGGYYGGFGGNRGGGNNGGRGGTPAAPDSEARQAASRVVAVPDAQSNSVVVAAPDEYMPNITDIVTRLDTNVSDITETRIFRLVYADATELAGVLSSLYADSDSLTPNGQGGNRGGGNNGNIQQQFQQFLQRQNDSRSDRALIQARVVAVPDQRTNSILVSASRVTMEQIAMTVSRLDANDVRKQHVYVHTLTHADPDNVAAILRGMYSVNSSNNQTAQQPSTSRLTNRTQNGASSDVADSLNTSSSGRSTGR